MAEESLANAALVQSLEPPGRRARALRRENEGNRSKPSSPRRGSAGSNSRSPSHRAARRDADLRARHNGHEGRVAHARRAARLRRLPDPASTRRSRPSARCRTRLFRALAGAEQVLEILDEDPRLIREERTRGRSSRCVGAVEVRLGRLHLPGARRAGVRDIDLRLPARGDDGAGGCERNRRVHAGEAPAPPLRPRSQHRADRRQRPARAPARLAAGARLDPAAGVARRARDDPRGRALGPPGRPTRNRAAATPPGPRS